MVVGQVFENRARDQLGLGMEIVKSRFRKMSIRHKIFLLTTCSVVLGLSLACGSVLFLEMFNARQQHFKHFSASARTMSFAVQHMLTTHDAVEEIQHVVSTWSADADVECTVLYDHKGEVVAQFAKSSAFIPPPAVRSQPHRVDWASTQLFYDISNDTEYVGTLFVKVDTSYVWWELLSFAIELGMIFALALLGAVYLAWRLQAAILNSLAELTDVARRVTQQRDYSLRVPEQELSELVDLQQAFNRMLDRVQNSDSALHFAHAELEGEVLERTQQLTEEIRQREAVQQALATAKNLAESANQAKSDFLANMSHEMRTPLNGILGFTQLLQRDTGATPEERADYLATIHSSGQHLLELINDILDLSKVEAGRMEIEQRPCSPRQLVAEVVSLLRVKAQEKGLVLDYEFLGKMPEVIVSDSARIKQLLMNLVGNAIKFTADGSVRIVTAVDSFAGQTKLRFDVVDTGMGIPADKLEVIFDPFVQADNSVTRCFGGTGLGLAISRRIARALGGELTVCSTVGMGSVFSVTVDPGDLIGVSLTEFRGGDVEATPEDLREGPATIQGAKILVVDDGSTNRKLISVVLRRAGAEVSSAENGQQAVELVNGGSFDLVLMDMQMPVMDGYTATKRLRDAGQTVPIIALTANAMKGDEQKCLSTGCSGYLTKPIDSKKLVEKTLEWLTKGRRAKAASSRPLQQPAAANDGLSQPHEDHCSTPIETTMSKLPPLECQLPLDDPDFLDIAREFERRLETRLSELQQAVETEDETALKSLGHWLKGAAGTVGFHDFTAPARDLENAAEGRDFAAVRQQFVVIQALAGRIELPTPLAAV